MTDRILKANPDFTLIDGEFGQVPRLLGDSALVVQRAIAERRIHFTPEWISETDDAGVALAQLFSQQFSSVARRANRLPDKARMEYLEIAGVTSSIPRPSSGIVRFNVAESATQSVSIPRGFQVGAAPANDEEELVVFETQNDLMAAPARIELLKHQLSRDLTPENKPGGRYLPLGSQPGVGDAFLIGLAVPNGASISGSISLVIHIEGAPGKPQPISSGSSAQSATSNPVLKWQGAYDGAFQNLEVNLDETDRLGRTGIVQLKLDQPLVATRIPGHNRALAWIRLKLVQGRFKKPPVFSYIELNPARVLAVETIRDEVLIPQNPRDGRVFQLARSPVNADPKSIKILSDENVISSDGASEEVLSSVWNPVDNFDEAGPDDRCFILNPETGVITFGDGIRGAKPPSDFRSLRAERYQVLRGKASAVGKDEINVLLNAAPLMSGVTNTFAVTGGEDSDPLKSRIKRGPLKIRARNRSVAKEDYGMAAVLAPGANVARVHAIPGYHPSHPGKRIPGVVGVLVVGNDNEAEPPVPDQSTLSAVARHLVETGKVPAGVEVVAAAPKFRELRAQVQFQPFEGDDLVERQNEIEIRLNKFLHPIMGGRDETGWPFGVPISLSELTEVLMTDSRGVPTVRSVKIRLFVDGILQGNCKDVLIREDELFWPTGHVIAPFQNEVLS